MGLLMNTENIWRAHLGKSSYFFTKKEEQTHFIFSDLLFIKLISTNMNYLWEKIQLRWSSIKTYNATRTKKGWEENQKEKEKYQRL